MCDFRREHLQESLHVARANSHDTSHGPGLQGVLLSSFHLTSTFFRHKSHGTIGSIGKIYFFAGHERPQILIYFMHERYPATAIYRTPFLPT